MKSDLIVNYVKVLPEIMIGKTGFHYLFYIFGINSYSCPI